MPDAPVFADLHTHSTASDGELEPEALVDAAAEAGLACFALTDHDTVGGVPRALARGRERGVAVIAGCELTAYVGRVELHFLAYFFDLEPPSPLLKLLEAFRARRRWRALQMGAQLRAAGVAVSDEAILAAGGKAESLGQPHVGAALVKAGFAPHVVAAIRKYLHEGQPGYVPKLELAPAEVLDAVHASGGIAVLAHPGSSPHDELIAPLFRGGLDGIEAYYPAHSDVNRRFYQGLARRYERVVSGGSDFHGPGLRAHVRLGDVGVSRAELAALQRCAAARRAECASRGAAAKV